MRTTREGYAEQTGMDHGTVESHALGSEWIRSTSGGRGGASAMPCIWQGQIKESGRWFGNLRMHRVAAAADACRSNQNHGKPEAVTSPDTLVHMYGETARFEPSIPSRRRPFRFYRENGVKGLSKCLRQYASLQNHRALNSIDAMRLMIVSAAGAGLIYLEMIRKKVIWLN